MSTFWPLDVLVSWTSDDVSSFASEVGWSAGPEVYDEAPPRMQRAPGDAVEAHEQAVFWLAVGARRADFNQEKGPQSRLITAKRQMEARKAALTSTWLCTATGYGCSGEGARDVLLDAADAVQRSGLNTTDRDKIVGILRANRLAWDVRRLLPWGAAASLVALGLFAYRSRSR